MFRHVGTHHDKTGKIGELRIIRSSQVQDGVERLHIVAGETAREHSRSQERIIAETSQVLGVSAEELPSTVSRFFEEWKTQQKKIESLEAEIVRLRTSGNKEDSVQKEGIRYVIMEVEGDMRAMMTMLGQLTRDSESPTLAVLGSREGGGTLIVACTEDSIASEKHNSVEILRSISHHINGGGGGSPTMAQGGGSNSDGIPASLDSARELLGLCNGMSTIVKSSSRAAAIEYAIRDVVVPAMELEKRGHPIIRLNIGDPLAFQGLSTPEHMISAYKKALDSQENGYGPSYGLASLRRRYHSRRPRKGWNCSKMMYMLPTELLKLYKFCSQHF